MCVPLPRMAAPVPAHSAALQGPQIGGSLCPAFRPIFPGGEAKLQTRQVVNCFEEPQREKVS